MNCVEERDKYGQGKLDLPRYALQGTDGRMWRVCWGLPSPMTIEAFIEACSKFPHMAQMMSGVSDHWRAPDYWKEEYVAKVKQLRAVSKHATTLAELIDQDKANNSVRLAASNSRVILQLSRTHKVLKVEYQELLKGRDVSLETAARNAYKTVFARYHDMTTQKIAVASMSLLPTRAELMDRYKEKEDDALIEMRRYSDASTIVIEYIDSLFTSRGLTTDW